jgi:hypothetical protein
MQYQRNMPSSIPGWATMLLACSLEICSLVLQEQWSVIGSL